MKKTQETFDTFENGGLDDEDASAVRPAFPLSRTRPQIHSHALPDDRDLKRDYSRKNDVGTFHFPIVSYLSPTLSQLVHAHPEDQKLTRSTNLKGPGTTGKV
jgi:hypothetical protein